MWDAVELALDTLRVLSSPRFYLCVFAMLGVGFVALRLYPHLDRNHVYGVAVLLGVVLGYFWERKAR